jgi:hypothetical protein
MSRLAGKCSEALELIVSSLPDVPPAMRVFLERLKARVEVCVCVYALCVVSRVLTWCVRAQAKFTGARLKAVGAFVFLRFMQVCVHATYRIVVSVTRVLT